MTGGANVATPPSLPNSERGLARRSIARTSDSLGPLRCSTKAERPLGRIPAFSANLIWIDQVWWKSWNRPAGIRDQSCSGMASPPGVHYTQTTLWIAGDQEAVIASAGLPAESELVDEANIPPGSDGSAQFERELIFG